jgi:hypothetical protein
MTFDEFANNHVGKVYSFREFDCEDLVITGLKDIYDISVNKLTDEHFVECQKSDALFFACEDNDGTHCHVGLVHKGTYLHAVGTPTSEGQVFAHTSSFFERTFATKYKKVVYAKWR